MLKVEGLNAGYGSVNILWDIGFTLAEGEIVAILGSNGAGKTTMVRAVTGMLKPSSGSVVFNGEDMAKKNSRVILNSGIVQVPEGRQLFTDMTVLENLQMGAFNKGDQSPFPGKSEKGLRVVPKAGGTGQTGRGHLVRRRAADGGRGPGADRRAKAFDPG